MEKDTKTDFDIYRQHYHKVAEDGIVLGLRRYRFFSKFLFSCNAESIWIYDQVWQVDECVQCRHGFCILCYATRVKVLW